MSRCMVPVYAFGIEVRSQDVSGIKCILFNNIILYDRILYSSIDFSIFSWYKLVFLYG